MTRGGTLEFQASGAGIRCRLGDVIGKGPDHELVLTTTHLHTCKLRLSVAPPLPNLKRSSQDERRVNAHIVVFNWE